MKLYFKYFFVHFRIDKLQKELHNVKLEAYELQQQHLKGEMREIR